MVRTKMHFFCFSIANGDLYLIFEGAPDTKHKPRYSPYKESKYDKDIPQSHTAYRPTSSQAKGTNSTSFLTCVRNEVELVPLA